MSEWMPIESAPKDGTDVLVWFDHDADPYQDPRDPTRLTDYAAWSESGDFLSGKGVCVARWFARHWESTGDYGEGYWLPPCWFARENDDWERAVNPTHWQPLPAPPAAMKDGGE